MLAVDRRLCAEAYLKKEHLLEERQLLLDDMKSCLTFFKMKIDSLNKSFVNMGKLSQSKVSSALKLYSVKYDDVIEITTGL